MVHLHGRPDRADRGGRAGRGSARRHVVPYGRRIELDLLVVDQQRQLMIDVGEKDLMAAGAAKCRRSRHEARFASPAGNFHLRTAGRQIQHTAKRLPCFDQLHRQLPLRLLHVDLKLDGQIVDRHIVAQAAMAKRRVVGIVVVDRLAAADDI